MLFREWLIKILKKKNISNQHGTDKIKALSKIPIKFKISFDFTRSLVSRIGNLGCSCAHEFQK